MENLELRDTAALTQSVRIGTNRDPAGGETQEGHD